jgi:hypothetical protein
MKKFANQPSDESDVPNLPGVMPPITDAGPILTDKNVTLAAGQFAHDPIADLVVTPHTLAQLAAPLDVVVPPGAYVPPPPPPDTQPVWLVGQLVAGGPPPDSGLQPYVPDLVGPPDWQPPWLLAGQIENYQRVTAVVGLLIQSAAAMPGPGASTVNVAPSSPESPVPVLTANHG